MNPTHKKKSTNMAVKANIGTRKDVISYEEALHFLISIEKGFPHPDHVNSELKAIISHWLQSPTDEVPVLGAETGDRWRKSLATFFGNEISKSPEKKKPTTQPAIDFSSLKFPPPQKADFNFIDLFAGIGGFRIALQQLGGKCVFSSEWEPHAKDTYFKNFGEMPFGDIKNFTESKNSPPVFQSAVPKHDILAAGFPCQAFSQAGKQLGFNEARGTLFFEILKIVKAQQPRALILENVKRLKTHDHGRTFSVIVSALHELGYKVYAKVLRAYDFGLPQNRERIFIVAFNKAIHFEFPEGPKDRRYKCVGDILQSNVDDLYTISDRLLEGHKRRLREHRERGNGFGFSVFSPDAAYTNTISARYWKDGSEILIDQGTKNPRMLTPQECARLQGFPDEFSPHPSRRHAYQQFGNSVPILVVSHVAKAMLEAIHQNKKAKFTLDPLEPVIF